MVLSRKMACSILRSLRLCSSLRRAECFVLLGGKRGYSDMLGKNILELEFGESRMKFFSGGIGKIADGGVIAEVDGTSVLVTAVSEQLSYKDLSGLPLIVDYRETASAAGRIPYNFFRRELRPMKREILTSRLIDRSIRPLFPDGFHDNTQITCSLMSVNPQQDQEVLSINGTSVAMLLSGIPWNGPVAAVRVVSDNEGKIFVNPNKDELRNSLINVIVACTGERLIMAEGQGNECPEEKFCEAVEIGMEEAKKLATSLQNLRKTESKEIKLLLPSEDLTDIIKEHCSTRILEIFSDFSHKKLSRDGELFALRDQVAETIKEKGIEGSPSMINNVFWNTASQCMNRLVLDKGSRCDGRSFDEVRPISCGVDLFQSVHGSAAFLRGETQVVSTVTLDSPEHASMADEISLLIGGDILRNFMVHYDFPPYANNRTGRFMMPGRREIGHGGLAEKALEPLVPKDYPFTIRVNSTVTDSNGSSSMATVCGSSLALFDAGVPMSKAAAGVACGLILDPETDSHTSGISPAPKYQVLSDITGIEDALGCMDFKMAGTRDGVTACQIDVKNCSGLTYDIIRETVFKSKESRLKVLDIMDEYQAEPRHSPKNNGPAYEILDIDHTDRMKIIGAGGHRVRGLMSETGARIRTVEEGKMSVFAPSRTILDKVKKRMEETKNEVPPEEKNLEIGAVYDSRVVDVRPYGFMVDLLPDNARILLHASQISRKVAGDKEWTTGDIIKVKFLGKDTVTGRLQISHKAVVEVEKPRITLVEGEVYDSEVVDKRHYGLIVELLPSKTKALLHESQISHLPGTADLGIGDRVKVKLIKWDNGRRLEVSRKVLLDPPTEEELERTKLKIGEVYNATINEIRIYGLMLTMQPSGIKTLLHSTKIDHRPGNPMMKKFNIGEEIKVKVMGQDTVNKRYVVSRKVLLEPPLSPTTNKSIVKKTPTQRRIISPYKSINDDTFSKDLVVGESYDVLIKAAKRSGYIVELPPGSGNTVLLPAGQIDKGYVNPLKYKYKLGDTISVKYYGKVPTTGKLIISCKTSSGTVGETRAKESSYGASITQHATSNEGNSTFVHATFNASGTVVLSNTDTIEKKEPLKEQEKMSDDTDNEPRRTLTGRIKQYINKFIKNNTN